MSAEALTLAHQIGTALTVGGATGWLVFHFWPRRGGASSGCAHCPAQAPGTGASGSDPQRGIRSPRLRVID